MHLNAWIESVPPLAVYALVGLIIGLESLGIPLPGEITLVTASLMASHGTVDPVLVGVCASAGAILGDSAGYAIGRRGGRSLFARLGRRFPRHFGPTHLAAAERSFNRWGVWAVFFGRFVALLRIFAGPLAGTLGLPYWRFLIANALGGMVWAGGTTAVVYYVGVTAEHWLKQSSYAALGVSLLVGAVASALAWRRTVKSRRDDDAEGEPREENAAVAAD